MWKIFNTKSQQNESQVRSSIEARMSSNTECPIYRVLSNDILYLLTKFSVKKNQGFPKECYSGDMTLFELGCYLYFLVDFWHFRNGKKEYRDEVVNYLMDDFIKAFSIILDPKYANVILQNRVDVYSKFTNKNSFMEDSLCYLEELILRTGNNRPPAQIDNNNFGAITLGVTETFPVRISIQEFLARFIPLMYGRLKEFYKSIEEDE